MAISSLSADERETIIQRTAKDGEWSVYSCVQADITKLKASGLFTQTEEGNYGSTQWVRGTLALAGLTVRKGKRGDGAAAPKNSGQRTYRSDIPRCDKDGCSAWRVKGTQFCRHHQDG